ncbi:hypothetical protein TEA_011388 [Camellia sinensis var. sinensis]|uniref:Dynamin-type G domain-containing protein n=1 Tax=Camellia sinensis var. sinensis TaxID=542762 RepID=A0A4S4EKD5_CAMSN|nr:hypothetical protein TEA_011388 [Camellia sinensis var. sinensis]
MNIGGDATDILSSTSPPVRLPAALVQTDQGAYKDGRITGNDATKFFAMLNLPRQDLKQLVSLAQGGHAPTDDILNGEVDLENLKPPVMEGLDAILAKKKKRASKTSDPELNGSLPQSSSANWFTSTKSTKKVPISSVTSIVDGLKKLYIQKLKPLEVTYRFNDFESPLLTNSDFDVKPMVMLLGQYSTGKTTFIKHLLKSSYPGMIFSVSLSLASGKINFFCLSSFSTGAHIGPEPTTDRFVMNGPDERSIPGNTIAVQADMPFSGLTTFGTSFLSKFECSQMPHPQRTQRSYDFTGVTSWFAAKCDLILLLFDPHKLDISDEFKRVISSLRGHDDKICVVLNKSDQVDTQQLMRVYGALMWSLGKVLNTPEKPVNEAVAGPTGKELFEKEQDDLLSDLKGIPKKACDRRINEFMKRARAAKIHAYIIGHLKKEMPAMMGKARAQQKLIDNLEDEFAKEFVVPTIHNALPVYPIGDCNTMLKTLDRIVCYHFNLNRERTISIIEVDWVANELRVPRHKFSKHNNHFNLWDVVKPQNMVRKCRAREHISSNHNTFINSVCYTGNCIVQFIRHATRFGDKTNRSRPIQLPCPPPTTSALKPSLSSISASKHTPMSAILLRKQLTRDDSYIYPNLMPRCDLDMATGWLCP